MSRKQDIFESVLTSAYDHNLFVDFSREIITELNLKKYDIENKPYNTFSNFIARYFQIGDFKDPEDNTVGIFSVELRRGESVERARTAQRTFVKRLLENGSYSAALVAFYSPDTDKWRFSFVRMDYEFAKGKIKESLTPARRYSYLVGQGEPCHTAMDRLLPIFMDDSKNPTIDEIEESFSVEKVTKDFFEAYKEKYLQLADYLNNNEDFVRESNLKHFTTEQFTKKLLSQIVFLYFIQKKGWLGVSAIPKTLTEREYKNAFFSHGSMSRDLVGRVYYQDGDVYRRNAAVLRSLSDEEETEFAKCVKGESWGSGPKDFMRRIFENAIKHDQNFFDDCLEPLFYTGLNQDRGDNAFFPPLHCRIPFLNGGLFEELEHYEWRYNNFDIPNEIFSNVDTKGREADGILDIFDRYNFTMAEDEPLEKEVAVDPEMLGKVFENLLEVKDRKSKGAFYTPREIVHYMCSESLINYLTTKSGIPEEDIRKFITLGEFYKDDDARRTIPVDNKTGEIVKDLYTKGYHYEFDYNKQLEMPKSILDFKNNVNRIDELDRLLADVRVVDPAVGSGAFPLGLLNEIVKARDILTTYMAIPMSDFKRKMLYVTRSPYQLKTETIKNCIFACDIEPSATDITKLRLWLSLVIEDEIGEKDNDEFGEHTKPRKLPNLDCNVLCGNSLVSSFEGIDLICNTEAIGNQVAGTNRTIGDIAIESHINGLIELQNQLYSAETSTQKDEIKKNIQVLYDAIIVEQLQVSPKAVNSYLDLRNASSKPFILWQLYFPKVFKDKGGFDICIGNPPYIQLQKTIDEEKGIKLGDLYESLRFQTFAKTGDLYCLFYEKGYELLRQNGVLTYITSNKWMRAGYGEKLRLFFSENTDPVKLIDFGNTKVFESATVDVNILQFNKSENRGKTLACTITDECTSNLSVLVERKGCFSEFNTSESWTILSELENEIQEKMKAVGVPLSEWGVSINYGIKTGYNEAFIISSAKKDELIAADPKSAEIIRPILRGRDIKRYSFSFADLWLIATFPSRHYDIDDYPAIKDYLLSFGIERLEQTGATHIVSGKTIKSRKKTNNKWFETQDSITYWNDFFKHKIVYREISDAMNACIIEPGVMLTNKCYLITGEHLEFIITFLNSKLFTKIILPQANLTGGKGEGFLRNIPLVMPSSVEENMLIECYKKHPKEPDKMDREIDLLFCHLFGLTENETEFIVS